MPRITELAGWRFAGAGGLLVACAAAAGVWWLARLAPAAPHPAATSVAPARWPEAKSPDAEVWQVLQPAPGAKTIAGPLAGRFRLAGTFFLSDGGGGGAPAVRKAILDETRSGRQILLAEGESWDGVQAVAVETDHVRIRQGTAEETLWLSFLPTAGPTNAPAAAGTSRTGGVDVASEPTLETSRFGRKVGMNRWVLQREELLRYYREILDDPERIAALYVSLKPQYSKENAVSGYTLDVTGEADFFKAVGLQQGDVVRKVNSMNMTSQKRAEYFIGEFMKDRVNAFVFDIEREGKPEKLIYLVR